MTDDRDLACAELVELLTAYLDGSLDAETRARFDTHLLDCEGCENYLQQFRTTVATLNRVDRIGSEELDPAFRAKLLDAFRGWR